MRSSVYLLLLAVFALFSIGLLMIFNTTSAEILDRSLQIDTHQALLKQTLYGFMGTIFALAFYYLGYKRILAHSQIFFWLALFLLALVFVPQIGQKINGARRWVSILGFTFQPSEIAKYLLPLVLIKQMGEKIPHTFFSFIKRLFPFALPVVLIFLEPDNGTTALLFLTLIVLFFLLKVPYMYWAIPCLVLFAVGGTIAYNMPHVRSRIAVYLDPEKDLQGKGHQPHQAKIAAGSGGLWGKGIGESLQKLTYLPEARSDYIAAIFAEECGFIGIVLLIGLYMLIVLCGVSIAMQAKDPLGFYTASIITFLLSIQAFINLGVVSNLLPSKGTTLPFISQGGSALITTLCALGVLISVGKHAQKKS